MLASVLSLTAAEAAAEALLPYVIEGDGIAAPLTGHPGDPARGRQIVMSRQVGTCLLCHTGPFPEERFQGTIGPDLAGVASRLSEAQIRLRLVDAAISNPNTVMPAYYVVDRLSRVGKPWQGRPVLSAEQMEDVVAFLVTLRDKP
jgi:sulfur-oxidizing protein SoxX